jgi:SHS2 domain-containing protein
MDSRTMRKSFDILDHTADVGIIAYGTDMKQLFSNAALALFSLITEPDCVEEKMDFRLHVKSEGSDNLLVDWLNELIYYFDVKHVLVHRCNIESLTTGQLTATCRGENFDPAKHKLNRGIKAATYHMLKLERNSEGYRAQIILDI